MTARKLKLLIATKIQRILAKFFFAILKFSPGGRHGTVIGFSETCGLVAQSARLLEDSETVCFENDFFFNNHLYDFSLKPGKFYKLRRVWVGAWTVARIARKKKLVIYIGWDKLLIDGLDYGAFEFSFLKAQGVSIIVWFTGSDIRSLSQVKKLHSGDTYENWADIMPLSFPNRESLEFEESQRLRASVAESFADLIVNNERDQTSYLNRCDSDTFPITDPIFFESNLAKFSNTLSQEIQILHAPSNPVIKGTPLVRAAVKRLKNEGYRINYIEARNSDREDMRKLLHSSHVVLNQFYSKIPGHFGFEAMASSCILLQSAEFPTEEFPKVSTGSNPWVRCSTSNIYDRLKEVLDDIPSHIATAQSGYEYAFFKAHPESVRPRLNELVDRIS